MPDEGVAAELLAQPCDRELGDAAAAPAAQSNQPADPQIRHPGDMERDHARRLRHPYPVFLFCSQHQDATASVIVKPDAGQRQALSHVCPLALIVFSRSLPLVG
jgi:hypothetical protein